MYRMSAEERRIIERTKREGEELQRHEETEGKTNKGYGIRSLVIFAVVFALLCLTAIILFSVGS